MKAKYATLLQRLNLLVAATAIVGCTDETAATSSTSSPGMLNGMLNGLFRTEGLTQFLATECPLLQQRLLETGDLEQPFPAELGAELDKAVCNRFLFYTAQLMVPLGESITLTAGPSQVVSFAGKMGLQHLVQQVYPQYEFVEHAFQPQYPAARKIVTQGYAALTNGITRRVSFKTGVPELDAHRAPIEDTWPREFLQLVPFTPAALAAMAVDPVFLARLPDFFNSCDPQLTNYDYLKQPPPPQPQCNPSSAVACKNTALSLLPPGPTPGAPPPGYCPIPVVVHGNLDFVDDVVPGRSCRILQPGEQLPPGALLSGDVIVPEGGCPLIYYAGRSPAQIIYDDRQQNPESTDDGCDVMGPSSLEHCDFDVVAQDGEPVPDDYLAHYVFNVEPLAP